MKFELKMMAGAVAAALLAGQAFADPVDNPELAQARRPVTASAVVQGTDQVLTYEVVDDRAMLGDIVLGKHKDIQARGIPPLFVENWTRKSANQSAMVAMDNVYKSATRWPNNTLYYTLDPLLTQKKLDAIAAGMKLITDSTAIRFVKRTNEPNYVKYTSSGGCWSYAGMVGGEQPISIGDGCEKSGVAAHETMHSLGWMHEHMRPDRDTYVKVNTENISSSMQSQFTKLRPDQVVLNGPYDLDSVMHYPSWAFSANGKPTIEPVDPAVDPKRMGQRTQLSPLDIAALRATYPGEVGTVELKIALSAGELTFDQDKSGKLTLDVSAPAADLASLKFSAQSDNTAVIANSGVQVGAATGNQRPVTFTPVAGASGVANIVLHATNSAGKDVTATVKVTVLKGAGGGTTPGGGGTTPGGGSSGKPFEQAVKYRGGDVVSLGGKNYTFKVFFNGAPVTNYFINGKSCVPGVCTEQKPFIWGGVKSYWVESGTSGGGTTPAAKCDVVLDTTRDYLIATAGQQKSLVPAADVAGAPGMVWPDGGAQVWNLQRNADGFYAIISKASRLALDTQGSSAGAQVALAAASTAQSQQFCAKASGTGYQLTTRTGSLALNAADADGAAVSQAASGSNWMLTAKPGIKPVK